jgi:hypothetical protein
MIYTDLSKEILILDAHTGNILDPEKYFKQKKIFTVMKVVRGIFDTTKIIMHLFINYLDSKIN